MMRTALTGTRSGQSPKRAQTTVEFALIAWPFLMLLLATTDYAQYYFYEHSLRYALNCAGRYATPGSVICTNSVNPTPGLGSTDCPIPSSYGGGWISRCESIRRQFSNYSAIQFTKSELEEHVKIASWPGTNNATEASPNPGPGMAGDQVRLRVTYRINMITPVASLLKSSGAYDLTLSAIFLNEPSAKFVTYTNYYSNEHPN